GASCAMARRVARAPPTSVLTRPVSTIARITAETASGPAVGTSDNAPVPSNGSADARQRRHTAPADPPSRDGPLLPHASTGPTASAASNHSAALPTSSVIASRGTCARAGAARRSSRGPHIPASSRNTTSSVASHSAVISALSVFLRRALPFLRLASLCLRGVLNWRVLDLVLGKVLAQQRPVPFGHGLHEMQNRGGVVPARFQCRGHRGGRVLLPAGDRVVHGVPAVAAAAHQLFTFQIGQHCGNRGVCGPSGQVLDDVADGDSGPVPDPIHHLCFQCA